jgi:two-component system, chemotaxis family, sensor kinase CheA
MIDENVNKELLLGFIDESTESLIEVNNLFVKLDNSPDNMNVVNSIFLPIHSLKGTAAYFGLMKIKKLAHIIENVLDLIRKGTCIASHSVIDALLPGIDFLRECLQMQDTMIRKYLMNNV